MTDAEMTAINDATSSYFSKKVHLYLPFGRLEELIWKDVFVLIRPHVRITVGDHDACVCHSPYTRHIWLPSNPCICEVVPDTICVLPVSSAGTIFYKESLPVSTSLMIIFVRGVIYLQWWKFAPKNI
jgi:hypothetical protein